MTTIHRKQTRRASRRNTRQKQTMRNYRGGLHPNHEWPHYHFNIMYPMKDGSYGGFETVEMFARSELSRNVTSATVEYLYFIVEDKLKRMRKNDKPFDLYWKGKKLSEKRNIKLRHIVVDNKKLQLNQPDTIDPIFVVFKKDKLEHKSTRSSSFNKGISSASDMGYYEVLSSGTSPRP